MQVVEEACRAFAAGQSTAERQAAEQILHQFKQSPHARMDSIHLLTHSTVPMAQFHAVSTICELSLADRVSVTDRKETIGFLLNLATNNTSSMPPFVASALLVTIAILIKRNWLQEPDRQGMLSHMIQLASSSSSPLVGIKLLLAFVTEMRGSSDKKTSAMSQPMAFHTACRTSLEQQGLGDIVALTVHLIAQKPPISILEHVYLLAVELIQWFEVTDSSTILIPVDSRWKSHIVQPALVQAILDTYTTHRRHQQLSHTIRQVLILLASISGSIFSTTDEQVAYITWIFQGALFIFHNPLSSNVEGEVVDMCQLTYRLVSNWGSLDAPALAEPLVSEVAKLSILLLHSALQDDSYGDNLWQMEGLDVLMDAWSILTAKTSAISTGLQTASAQVVHLYLQVRLRLVCQSDDNSVDEDEDIEENVAKTLEEQLALVSALARLNAPQNLALCQSLLEDTIQARQRHPTKSLDDESYRHVLDKLHFLVLFTGIVLADDHQGETPSIPSAFEPSMTLVEQLHRLVLNLLADEIQAVDANPHGVSPYVSEQLLCTTTRLHVTYFDRLRSVDMIELYCRSARVYLSKWYAQPHIIQNVVDLFLTLPKTHDAVAICIESSTFQSLVYSILSLSGDLNFVPSQSRGLVCEAFVRIVVVSNPSILTQFVTTWHERLKTLLEHAKDVHAQHEVEILLELFAGLARSTESRSFPSLEPLTLPWFPMLVAVLREFHDVALIVPLVLKCACDFVEANLAYLALNKALELYNHCDRLISTFCASNPTTQNRTLSEEEQFEDIHMLLMLLSHLVAKDVIDFAEETANSAGIVADVVFSGLNQVIPLMTHELLRYPKLSVQYFTLVSYLVDVYPEKVVCLNPTLLQQLLESLVVGMQHTHVEIVRYSFQSVGELAAFQLRQKTPCSGFAMFIPIILHMLVFETSTSVVVDGAAIALYSLFLLERAQLFAIAQAFCAKMDPSLQDTMMHALNQLTQSILDIPDTSLAHARKNRANFKTHLYAFVAHVRGYIQIK
ncbi:hypothetical protein Ae201684P_012918 [Aphanomyces euteiches]|uniref:Exportin-4 n=1 Tax=Aphanomyces euteiches TaxID=100861 RepID=A0A6G0XG34_9STRA|nr:hypothetical protein Ae201684_005168 [Aphanomyces euteiches]KAH9080779.1 hypothetical protein Ae201684P_012918 [Aphanomyces euteiches]KAH9155636.1 hypothetical protein AeRB84_002399 [Aphanomyces euteiches]